jgi:arylsulfatase A-like enzyme
MTGVEPEVHGDVPGTGGSRYRGPTIAEIAKAHGLATGAFIGGVTLAGDASGLQRGFDVYDDRHNWEATHLKRPGKDVAERAAVWMKKQTGPSFTFVHLFDAHTPYRPPPPFDTRYPPHPGTPAADHTPGPEDLAAQLALYDGEIAWLDTLLPTLLEAAGPDTIIALFSDHGESFEHGYLYNHRDSLWDSTARVPLVIAGPGVAPQVVGRQVALTDLFPTVLSLAGLPGDAKAQGQNLFQRNDRTTVHSVARPFTDQAAFAARTLRAKGIWQSDGTVLGYNLAEDPAETRDLSTIPESLEEERARYRQRLQEAAAIQHPPLPPRALPPSAAERLNALGYGGG